MKNYEINKKIEKLINEIDCFDLYLFQKIVKKYLTNNCKKSTISDVKVWDIIEKMEETK